VSDWLILIGFGVLLLVADELRKAWHRRTARGRSAPLNQDPSVLVVPS